MRSGWILNTAGIRDRKLLTQCIYIYINYKACIMYKVYPYYKLKCVVPT